VKNNGMPVKSGGKNDAAKRGGSDQMKGFGNNQAGVKTSVPKSGGKG
jgi:hypothetical protein